VFRVVIDPGVLVAALISSKGAPRALLQIWIEGAFELIVSSKLLTELESVLRREKFRTYVTLRDVNAYIALLRRFSTVAPDPDSAPGLSPDPGDDYLIALAAADSADYLISGDSHLIDIPNSPVPVLSPRAFLNRLQMGH